MAHQPLWWAAWRCSCSNILFFNIHLFSCFFGPRYFFNKEGDFNNLTAAAYHKKTHLLVTGFASGIFHLHELPDFNLIHSLRWGMGLSLYLGWFLWGKGIVFLGGVSCLFSGEHIMLSSEECIKRAQKSFKMTVY